MDGSCHGIGVCLSVCLPACLPACLSVCLFARSLTMRDGRHTTLLHATLYHALSNQISSALFVFVSTVVLLEQEPEQEPSPSVRIDHRQSLLMEH